MALIGPRIKRYRGTITTDGAGAGTVTLTPGAGYKPRRIIGSNVDLTGGTITWKDNAGAGTAVNEVHSTPQTTPTFSVTLNVPTIVTNLRATIAGGGATKTYQYDVTFYRTRAH